MATKEQRKDRLARGLCVNCASRLHIENETLCERCKQQKKKHHQAYLQRKRDNKICLSCSNPVQKNKTLCQECTKKRKEKYSYVKKPKKIKEYKSKATIVFDQFFDVERRIIKNKIGKKYSYLEVIEYSHQINYLNYWICRCDCGELKIVAQNHLKKAISCGCKNPSNNKMVVDKVTLEKRYKAVDYTGKVFGKYIITGYSHMIRKNNYKENYWLCKCLECNIERTIALSQIKQGTFADCKCDNSKKVTLRELLYDLTKRAKEKTLQQSQIEVLDQASGRMIYIKNDLRGKKIGNLLVLEFSFKDKKSHKWLCQCDCGTIDIYSQSYLIERRVTNCGCKRNE